MLFKSIRSILIMATTIGLFSISCFAHAGILSNLRYYAGISAGYQHLSYKDGYGDGFFPNNNIDTDLYLGGQRAGKFGFEWGVNSSPDKSQHVRLNPGDKYPGTTVVLSPGTYQVWDAHISTDTVYLGINRYHSLNQAQTFRAFAMLGGAWAKVKAYVNFIDDELPGLPSYLDVYDVYNDFTTTRLIPMFKIGLEYDFTHYFGCRANYTWTNYASFGGIKSLQHPGSSAEIKLGNANAIYLGVYVIV